MYGLPLNELVLKPERHTGSVAALLLCICVSKMSAIGPSSIRHSSASVKHIENLTKPELQSSQFYPNCFNSLSVFCNKLVGADMYI